MQGRLSAGKATYGVPLSLLVFAAAWLLFLIEPMIGKLLLPVFGGSPGTWAACLAAFQLLLLAGYGYVHLGARYLTWRCQALVHAGLVAAGVLALLLTSRTAPALLTGWPPALVVPRLIVERVGLPFVLLSCTTPLLARFATARGQELPGIYAVSNGGALAGLVSYPLLVERFVALPAQLALWTACFVLLGASWLLLCFAMARLPAASAAAPLPQVGWRRRLHWVALAALPSALLVAITNYITVDVAAAPLLWVAPLAVYLLTFIVAFSRWRELAWGPALVGWVVGCAWLSLNALAQGAVTLSSQLLAALLALASAGCLCHVQLGRALRRAPDVSAFYAWLALGGALGGGAVSFLAPLIFEDFYELELLSLGVFSSLFPLLRAPVPGMPARALARPFRAVRCRRA